jgi:hypothetical protein
MVRAADDDVNHGLRSGDRRCEQKAQEQVENFHSKFY